MELSSPSQVYRQEAARLYGLAEKFVFDDLRQEFLQIARQYEALANRAADIESRERVSG